MYLKKTGVFTVLFFLMGTCVVMGQQKSHYSMYPMNRYLVNPAVGGSKNYANVKAGYRNQWVGVENAPTTYYISGHSPVNKKLSRFEYLDKLPWHGVGGYVANDQTGMIDRTIAYLSYSYHYPLNNDLILSGGLFLGGQQYRLNDNKLRFHDERLGIPEPALQGNTSSIVPDASVGFYLKHPDFFLGVSSFQLFQSRLNFNGVSNESEAGRLARHYFVTGGYTYQINEQWDVIPSFMIKAVNPAPVSFDINSRVRYKDKYWAGLSYRNRDAVVGMFGITVEKQYEFGYAYDFITSRLADYSSGSHELMFSYRFGRVEPVDAPAQPW